MRLISLATAFAVVAELLPIVAADFDVYDMGLGGGGIVANFWGWQVYDGLATCDNDMGWVWPPRTDASGNKAGVLCKGTGDACPFRGDGDPYNIEQLGLNFGNRGARHWSKYSPG
ncbi:hypothetical protein ASPCAL14722 [Aspergillus calidoustus]|uniref:Uncharacterized protein n=1 Tax=Aspergillus calidoustus TaxID=454130 RepID=A0A0U5GIG3_ASPCI|nr:hypothetical protein ASPCAL14722 [Aspergillus calidoustus]